MENNAIALDTGFRDWNPQNLDMARQWFAYAMIKEQSLSAMAMIGLIYWRGDSDGVGIDKTRATQIWLACANDKSNPHYIGEVSSCLSWLRTAGSDVTRQQAEINKALYAAQHPERAVEGAALLFGLALFYMSTGPQKQDCVNAKLAAMAGSPLPPGGAAAAANACNGQQ